jgi:esterase/lipase
VDVRNYFLHELKDQGLLVIRHIAGESNDADIFTKNVTSAIFDRHIPLYVGHDEYLRVQDSSGEAVGE